MGAPKGARNARAFQEAESAKVKEALAQALGILNRSGLLFRNISALAAHVSAATGQTSGNLRRNMAYRKMLETHLYAQKGTTGLIADRDRDLGVLKAKLRLVELEAANSARDKARLERFVAQNLAPGRSNAALGSNDTSKIAETNDYRRAFECTAQALANVLERAEFFAVNQKKKTIEDRAARPGSEEVVSPVHAKYFIDWLASRLSVP